MSYLRAPRLDATACRAFSDIRRQYGFIPNFYHAQTVRPDLIEVEAQMINAILIRDGALSRRDKEYIFLVCSAANLSTYCVTAHCEIVRMLGIEGPEPEEIAIDHTATTLPFATKAMLTFAAKLNSQPTKISKLDIDALHTYEYSDEQILEAVLTVGAAKFANFVAFGLGTVPDFDSSMIKFPANASAGEILSTL